MSAFALLDLHLLTPVMVTGPGGGDPNSEVTLSYIPGSVIRGLMVARYVKEKATDNPEFVRRFLNGEVRYLNGYLLKEGKRTLPSPASWQKVKDSNLQNPGGSVKMYDFAVKEPDLEDQLSAQESGFFIDREKFLPVQPERHIAVHIARRDRQRPTGQGSTVFRYESLAAGQTFRAVLLADDADDLAALQKSLPSGTEISVGRSHRSGYGLVRVSWPHVQEQREYSQVAEAVGGNLIVTLLSDCLLRDAQSGAYVTDLSSLVKEKAKAAFVTTRVVGGFNRKWNLPLAQGQAMAAGSVFVYTYDPNLAKKLADWEAKGIGERTVEGFGRIAVNWQSNAVMELSKPTNRPIQFDPTAPKTLKGDALNLAQTLVRRLTENQLESKLSEKLSTLTIEPRPTNSQLARLRIVAKKDQRAAAEAKSVLQTSSAMTNLAAYLDRETLRKPARDQLQRAKIDGQSLLSWLSALTQNPQSIWTELKPVKSVGGVSVPLTDADAVYYTARLVDAVCRQASKEND